MENKPVNIFWTGGWDSTFRVLQLLIEEKRKVQPHFVVRAQASVGKEITTMIDIRRELFRNYPETRDLLLPTIYTDIAGVSEDDDIIKTVEELGKKSSFAKQYSFCSRYCKQNNISDMELCIKKGGAILQRIEPFLDGFEWKESSCIDDVEKDYHKIFRYMRFPLKNLTKLDTKEIAEDRGWLNLLEMTWFCATPYKGKPCGFCGPCTYVIDEGFAERLPLFRRVLSQLHMPFRRFYRSKIKYGNKMSWLKI